MVKKPKTPRQFTPFEVGQVKAHAYHGLGPYQIADILVKPDGKSKWGGQAVAEVIAKLEEDKKWRGERQEGSGAPRKTIETEDKAILAHVLKYRGSKKVTVHWVRKTLKCASKLKRTAIQERLNDDGYGKMSRRNKSRVAPKHRPMRIRHCRDVKKRPQKVLDRWAYTDGAAWYLERTAEEHAEKEVAALGTLVWRKKDGKDALFEDCMGPSAYSKAQGKAVRVWGMLADGRLHVHVLDEGQAMNTDIYEELVEDKFADWMGSCEWLICDFEGCLRGQRALAALEKLGWSCGLVIQWDRRISTPSKIVGNSCARSWTTRCLGMSRARRSSLRACMP